MIGLTRREILLTAAALAMPAKGALGAVSEDVVGGATAFVERLAAQAIGVLRSGDSTLESREREFRRLLREGFDLHFIGRFALGRHWNKASAQQKQDYLALFSEFVLRTYSRRLGGYSGETFRVAKARTAGKKDVLVDTLIQRPSGPPIRAAWRVRLIKERYKIIDVMIEDVSMVVTQRAEFSAVINNHGIEGLLQALRTRTQTYAAKAS